MHPFTMRRLVVVVIVPPVLVDDRERGVPLPPPSEAGLDFGNGVELVFCGSVLVKRSWRLEGGGDDCVIRGRVNVVAKRCIGGRGLGASFRDSALANMKTPI